MVYTNDQVGASGCNPAGNYTKITEFCITFRTYPPPSFAWSTDISSSSGCNTDLANTNTANPTFFVPSSGAYNCTYNLVMTDAAGCISTSSINISCDPLAVSLVRYTGKNTSLGNKLEWVTAMEVNNHYFTIQRSTDGNVFTDLRTVLSQAANGNSSGPLYYSLMDAEVKPGNYYYRLTQTDINGETREAGIISIAVRTDMEIFNVRPNPTTGIVEVNYECESTATTLLKMYDDRGTLLMSKEIECRKGQNTLTLDLSGREDGLYLLSVTTDDDVYKVRLVLRRSK
jgi:hypothetical protein